MPDPTDAERLAEEMEQSEGPEPYAMVGWGRLNDWASRVRALGERVEELEAENLILRQRINTPTAEAIEREWHKTNSAHIGDLTRERDEVRAEVERLRGALRDAREALTRHDESPYQCESVSGARAANECGEILDAALTPQEPT